MAKDLIIPIVFPNYVIHYEGDAIPTLAHAGMLIVDGNTRTTRYYEWGRYDQVPEGQNQLGLVRKITIPGAIIQNGEATSSSLSNILANISSSVTSGPAEQNAAGVYEGEGIFDSAINWLSSQNGTGYRSNYGEHDILTNNCLHRSLGQPDRDHSLREHTVFQDPTRLARDGDGGPRKEREGQAETDRQGYGTGVGWAGTRALRHAPA